MDKRRIRKLNNIKCEKGPVVYWMSREQRVSDNWALICAVRTAEALNTSVAVVFNLVPEFIGASAEHYSFMAENFRQIRAGLDELNIPFFILFGAPEEEIPRFMSDTGAGCLVADFSPLKISVKWKEKVAERISAAFYEVDAHNIVPAFYVSDKKEYAARTIRPKINRLLSEFLVEFPKLSPRQNKFSYGGDDGAARAEAYLKGHRFGYDSGCLAAEKALDDFINFRLSGYDKDRNNPNLDAQSNLSPYFHFGQLAPQRAALEVKRSDAPDSDKEAYLEEMIVRRELSDNYCLYNPDYDSINGADGWALKTLDEHRHDAREYVYDYDVFQKGLTHDPLWNAAQNEMIVTGKMHGYMRMYWAKKILEWTPDPETAFEYALSLNDTLALDGRDPNGYVGVAWSVCGVHDRAWFERPVFGKIRYMNANGCRAKFDTESYIRKIDKLKRRS
ncbi:MAG: deoxyribodipyrimidine photo-lyase [Deferribacterales bacterium]